MRAKSPFINNRPNLVNKYNGFNSPLRSRNSASAWQHDQLIFVHGSAPADSTLEMADSSVIENWDFRKRVEERRKLVGY